MKYRIVLEKPAEKFIVKLPQPEKERVLRAISKRAVVCSACVSAITASYTP